MGDDDIFLLVIPLECLSMRRLIGGGRQGLIAQGWRRLLMLSDNLRDAGVDFGVGALPEGVVLDCDFEE